MTNPCLPQHFRTYSTETLKKILSRYKETVSVLQDRDKLYKFVLSEYLQEAIDVIKEELDAREDQA